MSLNAPKPSTPKPRIYMRGSVWVLTLLALGCATTPQTTRLQASDFDVTVDAMVASLANSDFLRDRTPDSPRIYITTNKVENLTNDLIPVAEQWMLIARVQGALPTRQLAEQKNIRFQIPPEEVQVLRQAGFEASINSGPATTHVMTAVFRSAPRLARETGSGFVGGRTDYYYLEYSITDVVSREIVWNDAFEFKREARGLAID